MSGDASEPQSTRRRAALPMWLWLLLLTLAIVALLVVVGRGSFAA
jgi:hypothetical protein